MSDIKKVLVAGANGMLGQDLCQVLKENNFFIFPMSHKNLDITNLNETKKIIKEIKPDCIINCAAYTNVDGAEDEKEKAFLINGEGSKNLAIAANENNSILVYISSDYVFDGIKNIPYEPDDKVNPINIYGESKLEGEKMVQQYCEKYYIARTSWLYGKNGKNFVETMLALSDKPELKVVDDQVGCPTWTVDLSKAIIKLFDMKYGIYHLCGSGDTSWHGFAKEIFKQANLNVNLFPCTTDDFPRKAKRPKYSIMNNNNLLRNWQEALNDYLKIRKDN